MGNFESWEIALLTIASFVFVVAVVAVVYFVYRVKTSDYTTGEILRGTNRRDSNVRKSFQGSESGFDHRENSGARMNGDNRRIQITSEDHYYDDREDDAIFGGGSPHHHQPPYKSGSERPNSP